MHYAGYTESRRKVEKYNRKQLIDLIEALYGWAWGDDGIPEELKDEVSLNRLLEEALRQHDAEWWVPANYLHHYPDAEE
jgi:hypothetical protein